MQRQPVTHVMHHCGHVYPLQPPSSNEMIPFTPCAQGQLPSLVPRVSFVNGVRICARLFGRFVGLWQRGNVDFVKLDPSRPGLLRIVPGPSPDCGGTSDKAASLSLSI